MPKAYPDWRDLSSLRHLAAWCTDPANPAHTEYAPPPGQAPSIKWRRGRPSAKQRAREVRILWDMLEGEEEQRHAAAGAGGLLERGSPRDQLMDAAEALQRELLADPELDNYEESPVPAIMRLLSRGRAAA